jgi:predicted nucleotidyltransferase
VPDSVEARLAAYFEQHPRGIAAVYLFGSTARGTAGPDSDVDLAILYNQVPPATLDSPPYELESDLERQLGRPVEVVVLNTAPADLRRRVLAGGRLLAEPDRSSRIAFEVRTRNEAFDLDPILRSYRAPRESGA